MYTVFLPSPSMHFSLGKDEMMGYISSVFILKKTTVLITIYHRSSFQSRAMIIFFKKVKKINKNHGACEVRKKIINAKPVKSQCH